MKEINNTDFMYACRGIRQAARISQEEAAKRTGIPKRTIESWESGNRIPPEYMRRLILNAMHQQYYHGEKLTGNEALVFIGIKKEDIELHSLDFYIGKIWALAGYRITKEEANAAMAIVDALKRGLIK